MTNDKMQVAFNGKDTDEKDIKEKMITCLLDFGIKIQYDQADIVVVELPDNEGKEPERDWIERKVKVWLSGLCAEAQIGALIEKPYCEIKTEELCRFIEQILTDCGNQNVFHGEKTIKRGKDDSGSAEKYHLLIIVGLKEAISGYTELFRYIWEEIKEELQNAGDFLEMSKTEYGRRQLFRKMQKDWILRGNFAEYYMKKLRLPEPEVLIQLSAERYEGSESEARIYFTDKAIDTIETFEEEGKTDREITKKNLRMIRKLMEISKGNTVHLYAETDEKKLDKDNSEITHTISRMVRYREGQAEDVYVKFAGFMNWSLFEKEREIFNYYHGEYRFNVSKEQQTCTDAIKQIQGIDIEMIEELVAILKEQKHGTAAVIFDAKTDAAGEADRLCKMKRGTRIRSEICYKEKKEIQKKKGWNKEQILSITGIDGALLIDHEGNCLAIGVIVDGVAELEGNIGRGARFNSIANYIKQKPGCVGIVISEDGMINVIPNRAY